jgi:hypothetical protein
MRTPTKRDNKMAKIVYQSFCDCGWKSAEKKTSKEAKALLAKHNHKTKVTEWTVTKGKYMTTYTGKKVA